MLFAPNFVLRPKFRLASGAVVVTVHDLAFRRFPWTVADDTRAELEWGVDRTLSRARAGDHRVARPCATSFWPLNRSTRRVSPRFRMVRGTSRAGTAKLPEGIPERYVLHVGTIEPRKNIGLLLAVWEEWVAEDPAAPILLLCGRRGWKSDALHRSLARGRAGGWLSSIPVTSTMPPLAALYRHALAVACPSLYEGFGLPLAEALAVGTPVVASDIRGVSGGRRRCGCLPAAWMASRRGSERWPSWSRQTLRCAARLAALGRERAGALDWSRAAAQTRAVLQRAARGR